MTREQQELFSTDILNRGIKDSGPYAGSLSFSVRVRQGLPDFLNSVNLKYVKLSYQYLISPPGFYFLLAPVLIVTLGAEMEKLTLQGFVPKSDPMDAVFLVVLLGFTLYIYLTLTPRSTYLLDFACFRPPDELKISKSEFIELARRSGNFSDAAIVFQQRVLKNSGIGDETYMPRSVFQAGYEASLKDGREEASMVMFGAIDDLLATTKIKLRDISILVVNCGVLNTTPSLSAMVTNHYKLSHNIQSFNLGAMGCAASLAAIDLARDLLRAYPGSYALVVSTEVVSSTWYSGCDPNMLLPNCFFRMGAAAMMLSSCRLDRWRSKYELKQIVRIHEGMDQKSFKTIHLKEDGEGKQGLSVSKDVIEVGGHALKANMTSLWPSVFPFCEQVYILTNLLLKNNKPYIPNYKLAFKHMCMSATSKKALYEIQKSLELSMEYMEASWKTLERFGNTSSSSIWYELAYLEAKGKIKRGDLVWQTAFGSGLQCNSGVWKALRCIGMPKKSPWLED